MNAVIYIYDLASHLINEGFVSCRYLPKRLCNI